MPELDGPGLYRELEPHQPQVLQRMVLLTGDTLSPETRAFLEWTDGPRLTKPFFAAEARRVVGQALRGHRGRRPYDSVMPLQVKPGKQLPQRQSKPGQDLSRVRGTPACLTSLTPPTIFPLPRPGTPHVICHVAGGA